MMMEWFYLWCYMPCVYSMINLFDQSWDHQCYDDRYTNYLIIMLSFNITGEPLMKRGDDTEDKLKARLSEFHNKTSPVLEYYNDKVANINADADLDLITEKIRQALN